MLQFKRSVKKTIQEDMKDLSPERFLMEKNNKLYNKKTLYNGIIKSAKKNGCKIIESDSYINDNGFALNFYIDVSFNEKMIENIIFSILKDVGIDTKNYGISHSRGYGSGYNCFTFELGKDSEIELIGCYSLYGYDDYPSIGFDYKSY